MNQLIADMQPHTRTCNHRCLHVTSDAEQANMIDMEGHRDLAALTDLSLGHRVFEQLGNTEVPYLCDIARHDHDVA